MKRNVKSLFVVFVMIMMLSSLGCSKVNDDVSETKSLKVTSSMKLEYAKNFSVDFCEGGYSIITDALGKKLLVVPEGKEVPSDTGDMTILKQPLNKVGCFSSSHIGLLNSVDEVEKVALVTVDKDRWYIDSIKNQMQEGKTVYVGKSSSPDYEKIAALKPDVIMVSANTVHGGDALLSKLDELGIPYISIGHHHEMTPFGRAEWSKLMGVLFNKQDKAEEYYNDTVKKVTDIEKEASKREEHPITIQTYINKGMASVYNQGDYVSKMIEMSGGDYPFKDLKKDQYGTTKMTPEEFYNRAKDTQVLIYDNMTDSSVKSIEDIVAKGDYFKNMPAIKNGNVWIPKKIYWQSSDDIVGIIKDINTIIYNPEDEESMKYFTKAK